MLPIDDQPEPVHVSIPLAEAMGRIAERISAARLAIRPASVPQDDAETSPTPVLTKPRGDAMAATLDAS